MKCYTTDGKGIDNLKLENRAAPSQPEQGEVLVDVSAVSLNYRDILVAEGKYGGKYDPPIIVCSDMAGTVNAVGKGVMEFKQGDRVINAPFKFWPAGTLRSSWARTFVGGTGRNGVLAKQVLYPEAGLVRMPSHFSYEEGATLTVAGLTAWAALVTHGGIKPGDWVLLHGTGGVSIFAAQIAQVFGAKVIMTTSNEDKARIVKYKFGVNETLDYRSDDWPQMVREITESNGADIVVDVAGGSMFPSTLKACALGAKIALIGILDGLDINFRATDVIMRHIDVKGILVGSTEELRNLTKTYETKKLHPYIDKVFPFDETPDAYKYLKSQKHIGKIVISF